MLILALACAAPSPTLSLPVGPPADHAQGVALADLLAPTELGASNGILCPWARGERVPDASIARWIAEKRLVYRVARLDPDGTTVGGMPLDGVAAMADAITGAERTCGAELSRDVLVAAGPDTPYGRIVDAMWSLGMARMEPAWILVDGRVTARPPAPVPAAEPGPVDLAAALATPPGRSLVVDLGELGVRFDGEPIAGVEEGLARHPTCVTVAAPADRAWRDVVKIVDTAWGDPGVLDVMLAGSRRLAVSAGAPTERAVALREPLPALPISMPRIRAPGHADPCGVVAMLDVSGRP